MKATKHIVLAVLLILSCTTMTYAQFSETTLADTTKLANEQYNPELGYFQKVYSDLGDPRYMYGSGDFAIGIGGTVRASAFFDIYGSPIGNAPKFAASKLSIPTDNANKFGLSASSSELHVKARNKIGKHQVIAYVKLNTNDDELIQLSQAYVSFDGFTIGKVYSFFMDLEAGAMTVDLKGPNTQINNTQPLVGYLHQFGKNWTLGVSAEQPAMKATDIEEYGVEPDNQSMPDFVLSAKYKWSKGHIRAATLLRNMSYWQHQKGQVMANVGNTEHLLGWGVTLSGKVQPTEKLQISAQGYYGKGLSHYINDLSGMDLDCDPDDWNAEEQIFKSMKPIPIYGGFIAGNYKWNKKLISNIVCGFVNTDRENAELYSEKFKNSAYLALNTFYAINDYCMIGLEYDYGFRKNYSFSHVDSESRGVGNRLNTTFIYQF